MIELAALIILIVIVRIAFRRFVKHVSTPDSQARCPCGYIVENLAMPRCPECGRVLGFNATAEELGLTDEELLRAQNVKMKRKDENSAG